MIDKWAVVEAYRRVKANQGAAGVHRQSLQDFEGDLTGNLYKIWNRMSSGTYLPPPVKAVAIPKAAGGTRILGVPTVADRIAQSGAAMALEPKVEPLLPRLLRLPAAPVGDRRRAGLPAAVLGERLGDRS